MGVASADRHCRSWHNIAAGCCVASGEAFTTGAASAKGDASVAVSVSSISSISGTGVRVGEREAGLTVLLDGMAVNSCSSEPALSTDKPCPSWELKSSCEKVTGDGRRASKVGAALAITLVGAR